MSLLQDAFVYLVAMVVAVPLARRLGLGSVLGYLIAGIMIGPALGVVGSETEEVKHFAELGVVMMLFLIGLELRPARLWRMRSRLLGLGGLQVVGTTILVAIAAVLLDHSPRLVDLLRKFGLRGYYGDATRSRVAWTSTTSTRRGLAPMPCSNWMMRSGHCRPWIHLLTTRKCRLICGQKRCCTSP